MILFNFVSYELSRLVFTSDQVVVGVVIRMVELVKIKPTESEA